MKKFYLILFLLLNLCVARAQSPCQTSIDSIYLDSSTSDCSHQYFKYKTTGPAPVSYFWTYGDGNSCTCIKPKNVYRQNGSFDVCGIVKDQNGCADTLCVTTEVNCSNPCDLSGIGIYSMDTLSYSCNEIEFITITSSNTKKIRWDFGDGDSADTDYFIHTYQNNGNYRVRLIISDSIACADTSELNILIDCPETAPCNFHLNTMDTLRDSDCKTMLFSVSSNQAISTVTWVFGDGNFENGDSSESHRYADTGSYRVCAIAGNGSNCLDTVCLQIKVYCPEQTQIKDRELKTFRFYPQPFQSYLTLETNETLTIELYDAGMRRILFRNLPLGSTELDLEFLQAGFYLMSVKDSRGAATYHKIIKQ